jgi:hypothetical protein
MARRIRDYECKKSLALPNAANQVNTNVIDLSSNAPDPVQEGFLVELAITAATSANTLNINIAVQDSNESNANFTNITSLSSWVNLGVGSAYVAATRTQRLPAATKRYIRATAKGEANGGDASDGTFSIALLF